jgi:kynurenine formamidase
VNSLNVDLRGLVGKRHALDLTHPLANGDPIFPGQQGFSFDVLGTLGNPDLPLYYGCISFMEHCGTHMDSPAHVVADGRYLHELTLPELIAPAIKLDLRAECRDRADYDVSEGDIAAFEAAHGPIAPGSLVFLHTGWDARYQDPDAFIVASDDGEFHWPGLSREAAALLVTRGVRGVGIDTIGMDAGHVAMTLGAHRALLSSGAFILKTSQTSPTYRQPEASSWPCR